MGKEYNKKDYIESRKKHYSIAILTNSSFALLIGGVLLILEGFWGVLVAGIVAVVFWFIVWLLIECVVRPRWKIVKNLWFYFPFTMAIFWYAEERSERKRLEEIINRIDLSTVPEMRIIRGLADPKLQTETLEIVLSSIRTMPGQALARVLDEIRSYVPSIATKHGTVEYELLLKIARTVPQLEPRSSPIAWDYFLAFLGDIYKPASNYDRKVRRDILPALEEAIPKVSDRHRPAIVDIIDDIMSDDSSEHDISRQVLKTILTGKSILQIQQAIFDKSVKRASIFPAVFGCEVLYALKELGHRAFWLDIYSLRSLWSSPENYRGSGIMSLNMDIFIELCKTVFSRLENPIYEGIHNGRVYKRITGHKGRVKIECTLPGSRCCTCEGECLSFRGLFSPFCPAKPHEKILRLRVCPVTALHRCFSFYATVTEFHTDGKGKPTIGRGIFFEHAEDAVVKELYEYISNIR